MRKVLIVLFVIVLMSLSSLATFLFLTEKYVDSCSVAMGVLYGKIIVINGDHLKEINHIKNFNELLESVIKNKISMLDTTSDYLDVFSMKNAITIDKSFLHLRLGFLYKEEGRKDMADIEFETALKMYNSVKDQPIKLEKMIDIYEKLNR